MSWSNTKFVKYMCSITRIGYVQITFGLYFKSRPCAQPLDGTEMSLICTWMKTYNDMKG